MPMSRLAIEGGKPVRTSILDAHHPRKKSGDIAALTKVLSSGSLFDGPWVRELEARIATLTGTRFAIALASHAAAIQAAGYALGLEQGDEVVVPSLAPLELAHGIVHQKAKCVFADIRTDSLNVNPQDLSDKINGSTKMIALVHFGGRPCSVEAIVELARQRGVAVLDHGTEALGAMVMGRMVGGLGDIGVVSFEALSAPAAGGVVVTNSEEHRDWILLFRNLGVETRAERMTKQDGPWHAEVQELGFDYRLSDLHAALLLNHLETLEESKERRREVASRYYKNLSGIPGIILPSRPEGDNHAWLRYCVLIDRSVIDVGRKAVYEAIRAENIAVEVPMKPLHTQPFYKWQDNPNYCTFLVPPVAPTAEDVYARILGLPIAPWMSKRDVEHVVRAVIKVFTRFTAKGI